MGTKKLTILKCGKCKLIEQIMETDDVSKKGGCRCSVNGQYVKGSSECNLSIDDIAEIVDQMSSVLRAKLQ